MIIILKIIAIGFITGILSGFFSTIFLKSLFYVTELRVSNPSIILLLPIFGLISAYTTKFLTSSVDIDMSFIKSESFLKNKFIRFTTTPFILISSLGTHFFGGSAGREGVGVIMGASLSSITKKALFIHNADFNTILIRSGVAAGFSSIFGAPIAAIVFSYELYKFKDLKNKNLLLTIVTSSYVSFYMTKLLGLQHILPKLSFEFSYKVIYYILISGLACGLGAVLYFYTISYYKKVISAFFKNVYMRYFFGSAFIAAVVFFLNAHSYIGIGTDFINQTFSTHRSFYDFFMKMILTVLTLGIGYKGGEVTPLFFMGSSLSNYSLGVFDLNNYSFSASLGMFAFFGAATALPLTSVLMAYDLFGLELALVALPTCFLARLVMHKKSLY